VNAQHPGELTGSFSTSAAEFGVESTYNSWWPEGNKTAGDNPTTPKPSTVAISATRRGGERSRFIPRPPGPDEDDNAAASSRGGSGPPRSSALFRQFGPRPGPPHHGLRRRYRRLDGP